MATADLTVLALGRQGTSASEYIAEIQRRLGRQDRVRFQMHAMGTSLEGTTEDILAVVGELHAVPFEQGVPRVYTIRRAPRPSRSDVGRQGPERRAPPRRGRPRLEVVRAAEKALQRAQVALTEW